MHQPTAILLFSRSAAAEAHEKGFGAKHGGERMAEGLIRRTEQTVRLSGLPVFRSDETTQKGKTFGQRLAAAMNGVFAKGFENVIVVGNDCPSVRPSHLRAAARLLENGENVLGPDRRGGVWLLGLQRRDFNARALASLRWESGDLYADLVAQLPAVADFARLGDLNSLADIRRDWWQLRHIFGQLADLINGALRVVFAPLVMLQSARLMRRLGRAPPVVPPTSVGGR
ncbi:TIGR04282 family arsenosugar biosynthesis glycosyltransferase [Neolewinella agarilytica]|uniref:DUF2064 domain-containing protein n=1 Tax=Neolewinella agarilytica TaxID=478744 RepID=A0A1H9CJ34_9BACT|nr:DUF2064 domain-containing protein [Neolewinella agarilytica]SEQ01240.1 hypothetical protein SAMN05444359_104217 [Neolewinella agarilytica]